MKKLFLALLIVVTAFTACTKQRVDAPRENKDYKIVHVRIAATENTGHVIYSNVAVVKVEIKK